MSCSNGDDFNFYDGCASSDIFFLQSLLRQHENIPLNPYLDPIGKEYDLYKKAGQLLRSAIFLWIRRDVDGIADTLRSAAKSYMRCSDEPEAVSHIVACLKTAIYFEKDQSRKLALRVDISDVYNTKACDCYGNGGSGTNDVSTISFLWKGMDYTFNLWESEIKNGLLVDQEMVSTMVENCLVLCKCCQNLQQLDDALRHSERCIQFMNKNFPGIVIKLPKFFKLVAYGSVLQAYLQPGTVHEAEKDIKRAMHALTDIQAVNSVESAFVLDAVCRVLARKYPEPGESTAQLIVDFEELADVIWFGLDDENEEYLKERGSACVFLADFRAKYMGEIKEALQSYELASALFTRGFVFGPWSSACKREFEDQRACIARRIDSLRSRGDLSKLSEEPWKVQLQEFSLWGLHHHNPDGVRFNEFGPETPDNNVEH